MRVPYRTCVCGCVYTDICIWILCSYYLYVIHKWQTNARITVLIRCAQSYPATPGWGGAFRKDNTESSDRILDTFYERLQQPFPNSGRLAGRSEIKNRRKFLPVVPYPFKRRPTLSRRGSRPTQCLTACRLRQIYVAYFYYFHEAVMSRRPASRFLYETNSIPRPQRRYGRRNDKRKRERGPSQRLVAG